AVYGSIGHAWWTRYGGPAGFGRPVTDEQSDSNGVRYSRFEHGGSLYFLPSWVCHNQDGVCSVYGAIAEAWNSIGGGASAAGYPLRDEGDCVVGQSRVQIFEYAYAYFTPTQGVCVQTHGAPHGEILYGSCPSTPIVCPAALR